MAVTETTRPAATTATTAGAGSGSARSGVELVGVAVEALVAENRARAARWDAVSCFHATQVAAQAARGSSC
jgi:hypothetical protein